MSTKQTAARKPSGTSQGTPSPGNPPKTRLAAQTEQENSQNMATPISKPIDEKDFKKLDLDKKMDSMAAAINKLASAVDTKLDAITKRIEDQMNDRVQPIWRAIFDEEEGLKPKVHKLEKTVFDDQEGVEARTLQLEKAAQYASNRIEDLVRENNRMSREMSAIKGTISRQEEQIQNTKDKVVYLTGKSMDKNITISGIKEEKEENCRQKVLEFLQEVLEIPPEQAEEVKVAHRIGSPNAEKYIPVNPRTGEPQPRLMVIKCTRALKEVILQAFNAYKEKLGRAKPKFLVRIQLPDKTMENHREVNHYVWEQKRKDDGLPKERKARIKVANNTVYVDKKEISHSLPEIKFADLFPSPEEQEQIDTLQMHKSEVKTVKRSQFQGFAAHADSKDFASQAQLKVRQTFPDASHVITAFVSARGDYYFDNDGEFGAGLRLARYIKDGDYGDMVVCVVRRFGGVHVGPQRFSAILEVAKQAIDKLLNC